MIGIVGRVNEAGVIERFLADVPNGPVGLVIEGEPGIGKTTLVAETARAARERGYRLLSARPAEAETDLSFAVLGDLLSPVFDTARGALPAPQRDALDVALLRRDAIEAVDPRTTATGLASVLTAISEQDPLVVVVDDAQWIDEASRRALEFAVRRLPLRAGMVVARRIADAGDSAFGLDGAFPPDRLERVRLGPLPVAALHALLRSRLGLNLSRPMLIRVAEASGGNPFFALEIADAIARSDARPDLGDVLPVPASLQELLRDRVERLSNSARTVASVAAALSRPTLRTIEAAVGSDRDVDTALVEAESAGVLVLRGDRLEFSHPLLASTIYGSSTGVLRRALHRRLAAVVDDPEERARHLARSATTADQEVAAAIEAGAVQARGRGAQEAAAELFEAAVGFTPEDRTEDLARRLFGAATARNHAGDLGGAERLATRAIELSTDRSLRARALLMKGSMAAYTTTVEGGTTLHEQALAEAGPDRLLRAEILLALFEQIAVDPEMAARRADEAIDLLGEGEDPGLLARALISKFIASAVLGRGAAPELLERALALEGQAAGSPSVYPLIWSHWTDDLAATRARYHLHERWYGERGDAVGQAEMAEFLAMAEFRAGNWTAAERTLEAACEMLGQLELRGPLIASFADRSVIDAHRGRLERARSTLDEILAVDGLDRFWRMVCLSAKGAVELCGGQIEAAHRAWAQMREEVRHVGWADNLDDRSEPDHVEALIATGRLDDARTVLEHLEWRGRTLPRPWIDAGLPRARALLLAAEGRLAEALAMLESAPAVPGLPFEMARLLLVRGQLERRANRKLAAKASLSDALARFERLGSPPWAARARDEIARLGLRHRDPLELTASERRIAELTATGMTNRQVAEAAFVSPKTVEANLARVYQKLGIRSRAELGARMSNGPEGRGSQT